MKKALLCAVAAISLAASGALAQNETKVPAGGGEAPKGGEMKLPPAGPQGAAKPEGAAPAEKMQPAGSAGGETQPKAAGEQKPEPTPKTQPAGEPTKPGKAGTETPTKNKAGAPTNASDQKGGEPKPAGQKASEQSGAAGSKAGAARPAPKLSGEQRTKVRTAIEHIHVQPVHVNFKVNVGVAIPRTVELRPLPPEIITLVPDYEYFRFFVVPGEIVIVDPDTFEIVAILPL